MKKIYLPSLLIILLLASRLFYLSRHDQLLTGGEHIPNIPQSLNFLYSDGDRPWTEHIDTEINSTLSDVGSKTLALSGLHCVGDDTDSGKIPFGAVPPTCLQGGGAKMVVPYGAEPISYAILNSPVTGGFFEQEHMVSGKTWFHFFDSTTPWATKYFVIPFNGYEIPTFSPIESKQYLPQWKKAFQQIHAINDAFFNAHIIVVGTAMESFTLREGVQGKIFSVDYYYSVDWARVKITDTFSIFAGDGSRNTLNEKTLNTNTLIPIEHIATREETSAAIKAASPLLWGDVNRHLSLGRDGELIMALYGTVDNDKNSCLNGKMILRTSEVSYRPAVCIIN